MIILDRYEGDFALLEIDGEIKKVPIADLAEKSTEGTVLIFDGNMYLPDIAATKERKIQIAALQEDLFD